PPILLIACFRDEDADSSPLLRPLLQRWSSSTVGHDVYKLCLAPLSTAEIRALSQALLDEEAPGSWAVAPLVSTPALVDAVAREAAGSPLFAQELIRHARQRGRTEEPGSGRGVVRLDDVVRERVAALQ